MKQLIAKRQDGSTLLVTMVIGMVIGLILAGYLMMASNRFQMSVRSQDWNAAIPVLEAGVEEAMTHMTRDANAPTANNWNSTNIAGNLVYAKQRPFSNGNYFYVYILNYASSNPTIYSQGFVPSPYHKDQYISRTVKVGVTNPPSVFTHALAVNGSVSLVGGTTVDGFDSRIGGYNTSTNRNAIGGIATNSKLTGAVSIGSTDVYGPVSVGAGGTVSVGSGAIGDVAWNASKSGIEPGWTNNTMNVSFPSNSLPSGAGFWLAPTTLTNVTSGTYQLSSYSGSMTVNGNVTLYISGNVNMSGQDFIKILPGGTLKMIVGGSASIGGGGVLNVSGLAANFSVIGLNSCTSITYSGNASFIGTVNAPQAAFSLKGTADAFGAIIANSASLNGSAALHYDNALAYQDGYLVNSWQEL